MDGKGPWPWLGARFPAGVQEALQMHENDTLEDDFRLPIDFFIEPVGALGFFGDSAEPLLSAYRSFSGDIVGGSFTTPYLLVDTDDGGLDDTDEWWKLDPVAGTMVVGPQRIPFTCVLPTATPEHQPPFDVAFFGHGYGSSRFDMFCFAWAMNQIGLAACGIDFPGHGPTISESEIDLVELVLNNLKLMPFLDHLQDARYRDVNNDGYPDSGADQWIADSFHTRDMVRQAAVDWSQMIQSLQACGEGTMDKGGDPVMSCDWNEDGVPDMGGEDAKFFIVGGSLGGINAAITAAIEPSVTASASIVGAGGMMDIGIRSPLTGVVEAVVGRLITPLIIGLPDEDGGLVLAQHVISGRHDATLPFARLDSVPAGGEILVENRVNGEIRRFSIPEDGRLRVPVPGDAADATTKRILAGLPHQEDPGDAVYSVEDNIGLGDSLEITVFDADGAELAFIDTFETETFFEGVTYLAGSPLVIAAEGLGRMRGSPELRRLVSFTGMIIEAGDPIAYAPAYIERPFEALGGKQKNILVIPTPGDMIVAVNAEIALARASGLINYKDVDPRYGMTVDQWLIDRQVVRGLEEYGPWVDGDGNPALFDPDDLDRGLDGRGVPSDDPLRVTVTTDVGVSAMRMPYVSPNGSHGFGLPDPGAEFDINTFAIHQITRYFQTDGQEVSDDLCLEDNSCDWFRPVNTEDGQ
jgi:pimeloyl-ACP methyl ester carboxylesterase